MLYEGFFFSSFFLSKCISVFIIELTTIGAYDFYSYKETDTGFPS